MKGEERFIPGIRILRTVGILLPLDSWPLYLVYIFLVERPGGRSVNVEMRPRSSFLTLSILCTDWLLRLSRSLSQFETQDIKTQPQFNHYIQRKEGAEEILKVLGC